MRPRFRSKIVVLLSASTIVAVMAAPRPPAHAQDQSSPALSSPVRPPEPIVVRLHVRDSDHLNAVAGELDIWEVHLDNLYVVAAVTPAQVEWLESLGYRLEVDADRTAASALGVDLDPRFYYFDEYRPNSNGLYVVDFLQDINAAHPDLTALYDIGDAWMADQPGEYDRDIWVLRVTNEDAIFGPIEDKPVFFLFATIHAREVAVPELAIRYIKYLTDGYNGEGGYGLDPDVTWLVDHNVAYILVMHNPDGHSENEADTGEYRRKNMDWDDGCIVPGLWGVDLNRNHTFKWGCCDGSSDNPCHTTYRGPAGASEPETQAFENYFAAVMLDQNGPNGNDEIPPAAPDDASGIFVSLHSYGDEVLWPWGSASLGDSPNQAQLRTIGRKLAYYTGYDATGFVGYNTDGATDDWTYGKFGVASFTFEIGQDFGSCGGFFPAYGCIDGIDGMPRSFWAENKPALLYAHKIARTPYMTSYGPDARNVIATPEAVPAAAPVQLTATVADHRYTGDPLQPIAAAEYFVDAPGQDGTGVPMSAVDGTWGAQSEEVTASVDTAALDAGRYYVLVHGQSDDGQWGPFSAVFLTVAAGPCDFDLDGDVDLDDHAVFVSCLTGPGEAASPPGCPAERFGSADLNDDLDVDFSDFATCQSAVRR